MLTGLRTSPRTKAAGLLLAVSLAGLPLTACTTTGEAQTSPSVISLPSSEAAGIRQTDDAGTPLPFENSFPDRWSNNNDGTPYEPCTQVPAAALRTINIDVNTVEDVAASNHQTARGCTWRFDGDRLSSLSHFVGNLLRPEAGLDGYKELNSAGSTWFADTEIGGRRVLSASMGPGECSMIVQSGDAVVVTTIVRYDANHPPIETVCASVEQFLNRAINSIP
ncbi:DUF3558 family protein [Gordonia sp. C13]|uniref:DUF3558 family protein n=1 Tax=Gordonia sp. C13 TaxID=2935078 RepID=UPI00200B505A|nr:DUF3558 family protein [Gordonia sp. C13]MCK8616120.1 DUF3558 domain-containing protein [Gordonia sp. C13]